MKRIFILITAFLLFQSAAKCQKADDELKTEIDSLIHYANQCKIEVADTELNISNYGIVKFSVMDKNILLHFKDYFNNQDTFKLSDNVKMPGTVVNNDVSNLLLALKIVISNIDSLNSRPPHKKQNWVYMDRIKVNLEQVITSVQLVDVKAYIYKRNAQFREELENAMHQIDTTNKHVNTEETHLIIVHDSLQNVKVDYDTFKIKQTDKINPDFDKRIGNLEGREDLEMLSLNFNYPLPYSLNGLNKADMNYSYKSNYFFSLDYSHFKNGSWFGIGIEAGFNKITLNLTSAHTIFDSIPNQIDIDGDPYTMYVYGDNIQETATITSLYIMPQVCIKFMNNRKWLFTINPGVKFTTILSSSYSGTNGTISYSGYYPQYNSKDTILNGLYDYYQNTPVYNQSQHLLLRNEMVSLVLPVNVNYFFNKHFGITAGAYYDLGLTNILNNSPQEQVISYGLNSYNSLLYREESIKTNSLGIKLGVSFKF